MLNRIQNSPQYKNGKFHNLIEWDRPSYREYIGKIRDFFLTKNQRTPDESLPSQTVDLSKFNSTDTSQLNVTWLGHSSLMLNISGYKILTDPVYENKISFFGPSRFNGNIPLNFEQLPEIDVVVISHNHYDHLNKYSIKLLNEKTKMFVVPLAVGVELERWGIPREKISELDWWDEINIDENLMIAAAPAQHFSGRRINDNGKTLWASFVIRTKNHKVYFSGDSGYFDGFKKISEKYGPFDITFIECGAYNDKWHHIHMYPEETVQAHIDLRGEILHPIHWATFNLSLHPWFEPMVRLSDAAEKAGIKITTPIVGGTTVYNMNLQSDKWWEEYLLGDAEFIMEN